MTALEQARAAAYPPGEYVGRESFMRAGEIRALTHQARIGPGVSVLDLCGGVAGGRLAFTVEEGRPLTQQERARMPGADKVWLTELAELTGMLRETGLATIWRQEYSSSRHEIATALLRSYRADSLQIAGQIGTRATAELITAHQLWSDWLGSGRVRKFAMVAEKQ
jgi:hypothetical protein